MLRRLPVLLPVLALGAATAVLLPAGAGSAAPAETTGKTYVALGDSYAAGYGLPPGEGTATGLPVPGCAQTTGDYPHVLSAALGLTLTDVTCSGAETVDFTQPQVTPAGTAAPQTDIFQTVQPDLVTITIGGNDLDFTTIAATCLARSEDGPTLLRPQFASCSDYYASPGGAAQNPETRLAGVLDDVGDAVQSVRAVAPHAEIVLIAYPAIAPDADNTPAEGCYAANATSVPVPLPAPLQNVTVNSTFPFADADIPFLHQVQQDLDAGIARVAADHHVSYADIYPSSLAHSACAPAGTRWVEPVIPAEAAQGAFNSLHPNLLGTTAMANALAPVVTALFAPPATSPAPSTGPTGGTTTSGPVRNGGTVPLADTGVDVPVPWLLGLAGALLVAGGGAMALVRRRPVSRH